MATRTHQAPPQGARTPEQSGPRPETSAFQPRPFGETAPAAGSEPLPDPQTRIERAERFGHSLVRARVSSTEEAPIQRMKWWERLFGASSLTEPLLQDQEEVDDSASSGGGTYTPPPFVPPTVAESWSVPPSLTEPLLGDRTVPMSPDLPSHGTYTPPVYVPPESPAEREKRLAREADKARLAGMFNVTDEPDLLDPSPNRVTTREFDEVADLYSSIREGGSHLKIANRSRAPGGAVTVDSLSEEELGAFQSGTLADLSKILQTREGRTVLKSLGAGGKTGASDFTIGGVANPRQSTTILGNDTTASNRTGSGASVYYRPGQDLDAVLKSGPLSSTSDTMLFHELVHAHHAGQGEVIPIGETVGLLESLNSGSVQDAGVPREEYATVGLGELAGGAITENAYRASHRLLAGDDLTRRDKYKERRTYN